MSQYSVITADIVLVAICYSIVSSHKIIHRHLAYSLLYFIPNYFIYKYSVSLYVCFDPSCKSEIWMMQELYNVISIFNVSLRHIVVISTIFTKLVN